MDTLTMAPPVATPEVEDPEHKVQPPYAVVVINDDEHTFQYVIECFRKVFKYTKEKCYKLAEEIHTNGRTIVWSGSLEVAELKRDQIRSVGTDFHAKNPVKTPLHVDLEPMD